jgi:hypothetical protein
MLHFITAACRYRRYTFYTLGGLRYKGWLVQMEVFCRDDTALATLSVPVTFYITLN